MDKKFDKPRVHTKKESSSKGFSLFEVLISLLLVTSISLALLKQQWKLNAFFLNITHDMVSLLEDDNQHESNPYGISNFSSLRSLI